MYHLNQWFQKNTPKPTLRYKIEGEQLHREFQYEASRVTFRRFALVFLVLTWASYYYESRKQNEDFDRYYDVKMDLNVYAELNAGGYEFGEQ